MIRFIYNHLPLSVKRYLKILFKEYIITNWKTNGFPIPPPHAVKQEIIRNYQRKYGISILVETGTYLGDMVEAQKKNFKRIISIELSKSLFIKAQKRFRNKPNIEIFQGDSGEILPGIMKNINEPAIFWLDGHYSYGITTKGEKECPIFKELEAILSKSIEHILLIDDARCFTGEGDYPALNELIEFIKNMNPKYQVEVEYDIIRAEAK